MSKTANFPEGSGLRFRNGKRYYLPSPGYVKAKEKFEKARSTKPIKKGFVSVALNYNNLEEYLDVKSKVHHNHCEKLMSIVLSDPKSKKQN